MIKNFLLGSSAIGTLFFGLVFTATFLSTSYIETSARSFIINRIEHEMKEKWLSGVNLEKSSDRLSWLRERYADEIASAKAQLSGSLRTNIEDILAKICDLRCLEEKGIRIEDVTERALHERIAKLKDASERLSEMIKGKYYGIIANLVRDLRIFSGINLLLFLLIVGIMLKKSDVTRPLIVPAGLLFISTVASTCIYIFGQNWFYTILFNRYMGYGYGTYVGIIFMFLLDIVFNEARVTISVIDGISSSVANILSCFSS